MKVTNGGGCNFSLVGLIRTSEFSTFLPGSFFILQHIRHFYTAIMYF